MAVFGVVVLMCFVCAAIFAPQLGALPILPRSI